MKLYGDTWFRIDRKLALAINKMVCYHSQNRYKSATDALAALMELNNLNIASSTKKNNSILADVEIAPELNEFSNKSTDAIASQKLLAPVTSDLDSPTWNDQMKTASESDTIVSIFSHKSALYIGLVIGVVSGLALMIFSYLSIQTIDSIQPQNSQIKNLTDPD